MRILIVSSTLWVGGAERLTVAYAEGLVARGHDVHIAHGYTSSWDDQLDRAGVSRTNI